MLKRPNHPSRSDPQASAHHLVRLGSLCTTCRLATICDSVQLISVLPVRTKFWVGTSGWSYPWRGSFYPDYLPQTSQLEFASRQFNSLEINGSFYSLLKPQTFRTWYQQVPDGFVFAVKGSRFITHMKRLHDVPTALANFFSSGVLLLQQKLGPILWQLPETFRYDHDRLSEFLELLPRDTVSAAAFAMQHRDSRASNDLSALQVDEARPMRYAIEPRHESFDCQEFYDLTSRHGIAVVVADTAGRFPMFHPNPSCPFLYCRLHGATQLYHSEYTDAQLHDWAHRIEGWCKRWREAAQSSPGHRHDDDIPLARLADVSDVQPEQYEVFVYFDNTDGPKAPAAFNALALMRQVQSSFSPAFDYSRPWPKPAKKRRQVLVEDVNS